MPVYEYSCDTHGAFEVMRPMERFREPAPCPTCAEPGQRLLSVPSLSVVARGVAVAHGINERSRSEPRVSSCSQGHRQCSGHPDKPSKRDPKTGKAKLQAYTGPRPWVVEHA